MSDEPNTTDRPLRWELTCPNHPDVVIRFNHHHYAAAYKVGVGCRQCEIRDREAEPKFPNHQAEIDAALKQRDEEDKP